MAPPVFSATKHDLGIDGVGYLLADSVPVVRGDAVPATARAASGEGRYDSFQTESFYAQSEFGGGAGQARFVGPDQFLCGIGDGGWGGTFFPARKKIAAASTGGTASWYFERLGVLYGLTASAIEQIESATTVALTSGTPVCKPVVSGSDAVLWVTSESGTKKLRRWDGSAITDKTPPSVVPNLVARYGRWNWAFSTRSAGTTPTVVQSRSATTTASSSASVGWTSPTTANNLLVLTAKASTGTTVIPVLTAPAGWSTADSDGVTDGAAVAVATYVWYKEAAASTSGTVTVTCSASASISVGLIELSGCATSGALDVTTTSNDATADTTVGIATITTTVAANTINIVAVGTTVSPTQTFASWTNSYTELFDAKALGVAYRTFTGTTTSGSTATAGASAIDASVSVAFKAALTSVNSAMLLHYTTDDGDSWTEVFNTASTGIPVPTAAIAAQGFLWLTTPRGLYQMAAEEHEFEDHQIKVIVSLRGPVDQWSVPYNTASVGTWIDAFDGLIYFNVGATVRQFAPNGTGRQVWPSEDWSTVSGEVQSIVSGEGGIYFGAAGFLWRYNGRGVMPIAAEPAADDFDFMQWHQGRLYFKDDPASYFNFQYPSSRPDIALTSAANFETGYMVSSSLDFEKTSEHKVIRQFEVQGFFTAGANSTETGSIALHYIDGDGISDPGKLGGGATSLTWISCGTALTFGDGGHKRYALATPVVAERIYVRVTITPGTVGYPVLTAVIANGRAIMPVVHLLSATVNVSTGLKDRQQNVMYETRADAATAIATLETLRTTGTYFNVDLVLSNTTSMQYMCTFDQQQGQIVGFKHDDQMSDNIAIRLLEVP